MAIRIPELAITVALFAALPADATAAPLLAIGGQRFETLHHFAGSPDADQPRAGLIRASDGRFYGTTFYGGSYGYDPVDGSNGNGAIFGIGTDGRYSVIYSFTPLDESLHNGDGRWTESGLLEGLDGKLYGAAAYGGPGGEGTVFRLRRDGSGFTLLHGFDGDSAAASALGVMPVASLAQAPDGKLYGGTTYGGDLAPDDGVLFRMAADGSGYRVLRSFSPHSEPDGSGDTAPEARPLVASDGLVYGLLTGVPGAIYRMALDGSAFTVLHHFGDECYFYYLPFKPSLLEGADGKLYGACSDGGPNDGGALFRLARDGTQFELLHSFGAPEKNQRKPEGSRPHSPLVPGPDGYLYGTTEFGGSANNGTIYRLRPDGSDYQLLKSFGALLLKVSNTDGAHPMGDIAFGSDGRLYGTALAGGRKGRGTIFRLTPPVP